MAGSFTDAFEIDVLKAATGQTTTILTTTALAHVYVGLCTSTPTDATGGTEVSGGSYARVESKSKWATPSAGSVATNAVVDFGTATGSWGTITHFELWDASTSGNRLGWGSLTASKTVGSGDSASCASGSLVMTLD